MFHHAPAASTTTILPSAGSSGPRTLADPTEREELSASGSLTAVVNQHQELCTLHKPGGAAVKVADVVAAAHAAAVLTPQVLLELDRALAVYAAGLEAAARELASSGRQAKRTAPALPPLSIDGPPPPAPERPPEDALDAAAGDGAAEPEPERDATRDAKPSKKAKGKRRRGS